MADAIRITDLVKKYGTVTAVDGLSLAVPAGTMFGFLGPNGSGKSTTIGCLTGLLDPTAGRMEILGEPFRDGNTAVKRRMGVMPETLGLFDQLYAHEFLAFVARMFGVGEAATRQRVTELLDALELTDTSKTLREYSTGMRKRVAFAAAVIHSPEVLFLDEPFESIDPAGVALMKHDASPNRAAPSFSPATCWKRWSGCASAWPSSPRRANWCGRAISPPSAAKAPSPTTARNSTHSSRSFCISPGSGMRNSNGCEGSDETLPETDLNVLPQREEFASRKRRRVRGDRSIDGADRCRTR
jgi:ABC-type Na+ transport system ATPase subunit NatA